MSKFNSDKMGTMPVGKLLFSMSVPAIFSMLVVYCLRHVSLLQGSHGLPELITILLTVGLHIWKRQMLLSIAGGTVCYMLLIQFIF